MPDVDASEIERVFRAEYGRAVAVLVRVFGDIDIAEESVQDAFTVAVARWPAERAAAQPGGLDHHHGAGTARSTGCAARRPATTGTPRPGCCTRPTSPPRRWPCATTGSG